MARREPWVPDAPVAETDFHAADPYPEDRDADVYASYDRVDAGRDHRESPLSAGLLTRALRALSGSVAAGLVVLAAVVIAGAIIGGQRGFPGPGAMSVGAHVVGAVAAVLCQRLSDRRRAVLAVLASVAVFGIAAAVLWTQWWN